MMSYEIDEAGPLRTRNAHGPLCSSCSHASHSLPISGTEHIREARTCPSGTCCSPRSYRCYWLLLLVLLVLLQQLGGALVAAGLLRTLRAAETVVAAAAGLALRACFSLLPAPGSVGPALSKALRAWVMRGHSTCNTVSLMILTLSESKMSCWQLPHLIAPKIFITSLPVEIVLKPIHSIGESVSLPTCSTISVKRQIHVVCVPFSFFSISNHFQLFSIFRLFHISLFMYAIYY